MESSTRAIGFHSRRATRRRHPWARRWMSQREIWRRQVRSRLPAQPGFYVADQIHAPSAGAICSRVTMPIRFTWRLGAHKTVPTVEGETLFRQSGPRPCSHPPKSTGSARLIADRCHNRRARSRVGPSLAASLRRADIFKMSGVWVVPQMAGGEPPTLHDRNQAGIGTVGADGGVVTVVDIHGGPPGMAGKSPALGDQPRVVAALEGLA